MAIRTVAIFSGCEMGIHFGRDPGQLPGKPVGHYGGRHQTALTTAERPGVVRLLGR